MTNSSASGRLVGKLCITPVVHTNRLRDAEVRKRERFARALLIEAVPAVAAVVFSVGEGESSAAPHTDIGIDPLRGLKTVSGWTGAEAREGPHTALLSIMLLATLTRGGNWKPSRCSVLYTSPIYPSSYRPSVAVAQDWMSSRILARTSAFTVLGPTALRSETRLSMNSRDAISVRKWAPPFLTQVSVSWPS
jgi:hypothetical protein